MQKAPAASVSSGQVAPPIIGPDKESKEIDLISGLVLFLAAIVAAFWFYSQSDETGRDTGSRSRDSAEALSDTQVSQVITSQSESNPIGSSPSPTRIEAAPLATRTSDTLHDDILFEIGRRGLTEDGKAALLRHAEFLKSEPDWGVLLQGYTDQQGSMSYNKALGLKRADTVKQHLMSLGVPETAIRTVSLGEEGALCLDTSGTCRRMNRRVHLELRKVGREHMIVPAVETSPVIGEHRMAIESGSPIDETQGAQDSVVEPTPIVPELDPASEAEETTLSTSPE
jgi:peptidoglycan-associated lipoprotein